MQHMLHIQTMSTARCGRRLAGLYSELMTPPNNWLLFSYNVPKQPSTVRVNLWRRLRSLGALYIAPSVCVIPDAAGVRKALEACREQALGTGGAARLLAMGPQEDDAATQLASDFNGLRVAEYAEFQDRAEALLAELRREGESGKFIFAELEENEDELKKLERWFKRIEARDLLGCPEHDPSLKLLADCRSALSAFTNETIQREVDLDETSGPT